MGKSSTKTARQTITLARPHTDGGIEHPEGSTLHLTADQVERLTRFDKIADGTEKTESTQPEEGETEESAAALEFNAELTGGNQ